MGFTETEICKIRTSNGGLFRVTYEHRGGHPMHIGKVYEKSTAGGWDELEEWSPEAVLDGFAGIDDWAEVIRGEAKEKIQVYDDSEQEMIQKNDPVNEW